MNKNEYEMPNQEFIRSTIESLVGAKVNEIPAEQLSKLVIRHSLQTDRPEKTNSTRFVYIVPRAKIISGTEPTRIEQDTILSLAYALLDSLLEHYGYYHQESPFALVYISNSELKNSKLYLYPKSALKALSHFQAKGDKERQAKVYIYKLVSKLKHRVSSIH